MSITEKFRNYSGLFNSYLKQFVSEKEKLSPYSLYEPEIYVLQSGGKRLRPLISLWACDMFSGKPEKALPVAAAIELFHNFTLVHDDIMDDAPSRRGLPTLHTKWNTPLAILCGDLMLIHAIQQLSHQENNKDIIFRIFLETAEGVCQGQQLDMEMETLDKADLDSYLTMIRKKTAILLGCSMQTGAIAGGIHPRESNVFYEWGCQNGICFQLQDDVLDAFGEENVTGKIKGGDLIRGKKSLPYVMADLSLKGKAFLEWENFKKLSPELRKEKILFIINLLEQEGIRESCEKKIKESFEKAEQLTENIPAGEKEKLQMRNFSDFLFNRKS
jgi:geranylgeranyl diphosphate synthase type II